MEYRALAFPSAADFQFSPYNYSLSNVNLFGNRCLENAACTLPGGLVAFVTKNGMAYFNPDNMVRKPQNTRAGLTSIHINNIPLEQLENEGKANHDGKAFHLDHTHNSIQIRFSDFTFDREHNSQYTYWLEGYDKEWSEPSKIPAAIYKNLPPGTYRFHLHSSYMDNDRSEDSTMVTFVIAPPFWATWYAWLAYFIAAGAIIYFILRELEDKRRLRERIRVEQQLTDFKMHFFTNISHYIRKIRLTEAKRLLEEDNITVAEVSYKTGFSNPYYFSRCFKQKFGMPPSTYRKSSLYSKCWYIKLASLLLDPLGEPVEEGALP